jgi:hypothetical protein
MYCLSADTAATRFTGRLRATSTDWIALWSTFLLYVSQELDAQLPEVWSALLETVETTSIQQRWSPAWRFVSCLRALLSGA